MAVSAALQRSVVSPAGRHSASVVLLHGSGDTGPGIRAWIKQVLNQDLAFQHIKVIYPTAPARPYTPMRGALSTVWFDRWKISNEGPEHIETIDSMCHVLTDLIDDEVKYGISKNRIILGMDAAEEQVLFSGIGERCSTHRLVLLLDFSSDLRKIKVVRLQGLRQTLKLGNP